MKPKLHEDWIDPFAFQIVKNLQKGGFTTFLVGGCVRDLLAGIHPKDFDIATNALPQEVRKKINHSYIIGKRFRLVLAKRGEQQFEIATFRREASVEERSDESNPIEGDNFFGSPQEDALRRDFTVNGLFYDPVQHQVIDYVQGLLDIEDQTLRMIGDPMVRLVEDPIRILRAIRLAHKLNFKIDPQLRSAIALQASSLKNSVLPRRREEWLKILRLPNPGLTFMELFDLGVFKEVLPLLQEIYECEEKRDLFEHYLERIRFSDFDESNPHELFTGFLGAIGKSYLGEDSPLDSWAESTPLQSFMREDLGMFKFEMMSFERALRIQSIFQKRSSFERRGFRRRKAFLENESFHLGFKMSHHLNTLSSWDRLFWIQELKSAKES